MDEREKYYREIDWDNIFINDVNRNTGKIYWIGSIGFRTDSNPIYFTRISFTIP